MSKNIFLYFLLTFNLLLVQGIFFQNSRIHSLNQEVRLNIESNKIESDQVRDLLYQLSQAQLEHKTIETKSYVEGVVSALTNPKPMSEIWHAGYDRGSNWSREVDRVPVNIFEK